MLHVLSRRLPLPLLQIILLHNYGCGKAVETYTSLECWAWNYQLVGKHWGWINRAQHPPVILVPSSSLCHLLTKHDCCMDCMPPDWHCMPCLQDCGGFCVCSRSSPFSGGNVLKPMFHAVGNGLCCSKHFGVVLSQVKASCRMVGNRAGWQAHHFSLYRISFKAGATMSSVQLRWPLEIAVWLFICFPTLWKSVELDLLMTDRKTVATEACFHNLTAFHPSEGDRQYTAKCHVHLLLDFG